MQNCYVGDVGDFLKYSLLTFLHKRGNLKLGVNWYCPDTKDNNGNGKYINYLKHDNRIGKRLRECNSNLYDQLFEIVCIKKKREMKETEKGKILPPGTIFYGEKIENNDTQRERWHRAALVKLENADIVFLDPDNGIETIAMSQQRASSKHARFQEICDYYNGGQSVIIYNHASHEQAYKYEERFRKLKECLKVSDTITILRARRGTARDFVFLVRPRQKKIIEQALSDFERCDWVSGEHFKMRQF